MPKVPKVSVIIPAYNAMAFLPETLATVWRQTLSDFEVVIVNDGSTDAIEAWVSRLNDPRVRLISQANQGLAGARNTGIAAAQAEYLAFLDADDRWEPTKLEQQVRVLDAQPDVGLVYTWVRYINETGQPTGRLFCNQQRGWVWDSLINHNIVECGSVAMVRRSCFERVGHFDRTLRSFGEDWDMWLRIAPVYPFEVVPELLVEYRQRASGTSKNWLAMEQSFQRILHQAFATHPASPQQQARAYGLAYLCLAWKPLQGQEKVWRPANSLRQQALTYDPALRWSQEHLKLQAAIGLMRSLGSQRYMQVLQSLHQIRNWRKG
ncbi:MAG: glycosyltransferase family 2 protein [Elainella sp. Prado103]|nr:glycosyltransferase family 2 protein [Elainella sp. Prado103]